jgi:hypothetical protein
MIGSRSFGVSPLLIHRETYGLYWIGQIHRELLPLVGLDQRDQNVKALWSPLSL